MLGDQNWDGASISQPAQRVGSGRLFGAVESTDHQVEQRCQAQAPGDREPSTHGLRGLAPEILFHQRLNFVAVTF